MHTFLAYVAAVFYIVLGWGLALIALLDKIGVIGDPPKAIADMAETYPMIVLCCIGSALLIYAWIENGYSLEFDGGFEDLSGQQETLRISPEGRPYRTGEDLRNSKQYQERIGKIAESMNRKESRLARETLFPPV